MSRLLPGHGSVSNSIPCSARNWVTLPLWHGAPSCIWDSVPENPVLLGHSLRWGMWLFQYFCTDVGSYCLWWSADDRSRTIADPRSTLTCQISSRSVYSVALWRRKNTNFGHILPYFGLRHLVVSPIDNSLTKRCTSTNLLESLNYMTLNIENGRRQAVAYIDFAKAFDSVCHNKLLAKMRGSMESVVHCLSGLVIFWRVAHSKHELARHCLTLSVVSFKAVVSAMYCSFCTLVIW